MYRTSLWNDIIDGSCVLMERLLQSITHPKKSTTTFQLLEGIVSHILWIMSESIKHAHDDSPPRDGNCNLGKVVELVIGWMMAPQIVGFDCFGGREALHVETELKVSE